MIINMTSHQINIVSSLETISIPKSENPIRVSVTRELVETQYGVNIYQTKMGVLENMPEIEPGNIYIVSRIVKNKITEEYSKEYQDRFLVPEGIVRDQNGIIVGCEGLAY